MELFMTYMVPVLLTGLAGVLTYIFKLVIAYLKAQTAKLEDETLKNMLDAAEDKLEMTTLDVVASIKSTIVDDLKKNGSFSKENAKTVKQKALNMVKSQLKDETKALLEQNLVNLDEFIDLKIESMVNTLKRK